MASNSCESQNDDTYVMSDNPCGLCLLIDNNKSPFEDLYTDDVQNLSTNVDIQRLTSVYTQLNFKVLKCQNQTKAQLEEILKWVFSLSADVSSHAPCTFELEEWNGREFIKITNSIKHGQAFICYFVGHGTHNVIFGVDNKPVLVQELVNKFTADRAPGLNGKPKIFIYQTYQNNKSPLTDTCGQDGDMSETSYRPGTKDYCIGSWDVLTVNDHNISYKNTLNGSAFVLSFCNKIKRYSSFDDLVSILVRVNNDVMRLRRQDYLSGKETQIPVIRYTLRSKVMFPKKVIK